MAPLSGGLRCRRTAGFAIRHTGRPTMQVSGSAGSVARDSVMYEVFVSFTRTGHLELAFRTKDMLNDMHIPVFIDEGLPVAEGISDGIVAALRESRIMVVVYSASYNERW